jgi:hypothetical protein
MEEGHDQDLAHIAVNTAVASNIGHDISFRLYVVTEFLLLAANYNVYVDFQVKICGAETVTTNFA